MSWIQRTAGTKTPPAWIMALAVTLGGCGESRDSLPREAVSGKVAIERTPLAKGSISFRSVDGSMEAGGLVSDGAFAIPKADGPVPGKYQVSVTESLERPPEREGEVFSLQPKTKPSRSIVGALEVEVKEGGNEEFHLEFKRGSAGARAKGGGDPLHQ